MGATAGGVLGMLLFGADDCLSCVLPSKQPRHGLSWPAHASACLVRTALDVRAGQGMTSSSFGPDARSSLSPGELREQ